MSKAEKQALKAYPNIKIGEQHIDQSPAREVYVQGYEQAQKDIAEHIKLAYGKVSMNPFDCSEAFEELLKTIGAV